MKNLILLCLLSVSACAFADDNALPAQSFDTTREFVNPMLWEDVPDPDVIRVGEYYYLVSTTMHLMPGGPVMRSKDLVNWEIVSYIFDTLNDTPRYDMHDGTVYGKGQWATSLRYKDGVFYAYFSPNDVPYRGFVYTTTDPEKGWTLHSRIPHFHDASLFFDEDGRNYIVHSTGMIRELNADLTDVEPGGLDMQIFERDSTETALLEGSRMVKHNGKYYLLMVSWPANENRREVCYRADNIAGPYEKKVILEDNFEGYGYVGQGCIVDGADGKWYGVIFQDRGGVGRVLNLMPCTWVEGWPMLGDASGRIPKVMRKPLAGCSSSPLVVSDDFSGETLGLTWEWNHNPVNGEWSLTERPGYLRLKTNRVVDNLFEATNTLSQRMEGPGCSASVALDISHMKDGDVTGLAAFNGHSGLLSVVAEGKKKYLVMSSNVVNFNREDWSVADVDVEEMEKVELKGKKVYLRIDADFRLYQDLATFYYSTDNENWTKIGSPFKMRFDYTRLFMGTRYAIYNYATKSLGGYVDVDWFNYNKVENRP